MVKNDYLANESKKAIKMIYGDYYENNASYISECAKSPERYEQFSRLNIPAEIVDKHGWGYDRSNERCVFVEDNGSVVTRSADPDAAKHDRYRSPKGQKRGTVGIHELYRDDGKTKMVFLTEGVRDKAAIEAFGESAVSIQSTTQVLQFVELVEKVPPPENNEILIAFDEDDSGTEAAYALSAKLTQLGIKNRIVNLSGKYKDAHEAFTADPAYLKKRLAVCKDRENYEKAMNNPLAANIDRVENRVRNGLKKKTYETGFSDMGSFTKGELVVVGGPTGIGKSTCALQIGTNLACRGEDVVYMSYESGAEQLVPKIVSSISYKKTKKSIMPVQSPNNGQSATTDEIRKGSKNAAAVFNRYKKELNAVKKHLIVPEGIKNFSDLKGVVEERIKYSGREPVVIVDPANLIANQSCDEQTGLTQLVRDLADLAHEKDLLVIAVFMTNRTAYTSPIDLSIFRGTSNIEFVCDTAIGVNYEGLDYEEGETESERNTRARSLIDHNSSQSVVDIQFKFLKRRYGSRNSFTLSFNREYSCFDERG